MKICDFCGTKIERVDDLYVCKNGHLFEQQVEVVEATTQGRRASKSQKKKEEKKYATVYQKMQFFFDIWKFYKKQFNFDDDVMKIFLNNIVYRNETIRKTKELVSFSLINFILYLSIRIEKEKTGTYFLKDFMFDTKDIKNVWQNLQNKNEICFKEKTVSIRRTAYTSFHTEYGRIDMEYGQNKYLDYFIGEKFIIWIKSFLRIIQDLPEIYDFVSEVEIEYDELNFEDFFFSEKKMIEMLLSVREFGIENSIIPVYPKDENLCDSQKFPLLTNNNYKVTFDREKKDTEYLFLNDFIQNIYKIRKNEKLKANITNHFLNFIFKHKDYDTLFFYEVEICAFLNLYFYTLGFRNLKMTEKFEKTVKYLNTDDTYLKKICKKIGQLLEVENPNL